MFTRFIYNHWVTFTCMAELQAPLGHKDFGRFGGLYYRYINTVLLTYTISYLEGVVCHRTIVCKDINFASPC